MRAATATSPGAVAGKLPDTGVPGVPDAYTKPPPVFRSVPGVPGRGGTVTTFQIQEGAPVSPRAENRYWQELEQRLGVTLDVTFGPSASWHEKFAALTAGGELPDLSWLFPQDARGASQYRTIEQGAYTDLTPYLSGDALKEYPNLALLPTQSWENLKINKKIYGVPHPTPLTGQALYFRQDWAEKMGVPRPKDAEDIFGVLTAFSKNDPDGNGRADTYGLAGPTPATRFAQSFLFQMFRTPDGWRRNADGSLTNVIETDEHRQAIAFARRLWEAGAYHPDLLSLSITQVRDGLVSGILGSYQEGIVSLPGSGGRRAQTRAVHPAADVISLVPPGHDGGKPATHTANGFSGFVGIPAKVGRDRERLREMLRILNYYCAPFGSEEDIFLGFGLAGMHHRTNPDGSWTLTEVGRQQIPGLRSLTYKAPVFFYDIPGDAEMMQRLTAHILSNSVENPANGLYSPTAAAKSGELSQLGVDRIAPIVTGREPLGALDRYIQDWRGRGGDQIRKEYEEALKAG
jgi:putative aldouronate transport system substrate-binding protein